MTLTKKCFRCEETKTINHFHKNITKADGYHHICKECRVSDQAKYYRRESHKIRPQQNEYKVITGYNKRYYSINSEVVRRGNKRYQDKNREQVRIYAYFYWLSKKTLTPKTIYGKIFTWVLNKLNI